LESQGQGREGDEMKRYALFGGENYHPSGGMDDLVATSDVFDELEAMAVNPGTRDKYGCRIEWWHIADMASGVIVTQGKGQRNG